MRGNSMRLDLNLETLEPRLMLNGDFRLTETRLILDNFDADESLSLGESDTAFLFFLDNGDWQGIDGPGISGNQSSMLSVEKDVIPSLLGGMKIDDSNNTGMSVNFGTVDYSELPDTMSVIGVGHVNQAAGSNVILSALTVNGQSAEFAKNANDSFTVNRKLTLILDFDADVGDNGSAKAAVISVASQRGSIYFSEDGDTHIQHLSGEMVDVHSTGTISGTPSARIVAQNLKLHAENRIFLGTHAGSAVDVEGMAELHADTAILWKQYGTTHFGQLNFVTDGYARINESDATELFGSNAAQMLNLSSGGNITQHINGASQEVRIDSYAKFKTSADISLANSADQVVWIKGTARFVGANHLSLGNGGQAHAERLSFNVSGDAHVKLQRHIRFTGANFAAHANFDSEQFIGATDHSHIRIFGDATFRAKQNIGLGLRENQNLIVGGLATFWTDRAILINGVGVNKLPRLNFNSGSTAIIMLNSSVRLFGDNTAPGLLLRSTGSVWDAEGATVTTENELSIHAEGNVFIADDVSNAIHTDGYGRISGNAVTIGDPGTVNFGQVGLFSYGYLYFSEDSSTHLDSRNTAKSAFIQSSGMVTDHRNADITVEHNLTITADRINLGDESNNTITVGGLATFNATDAILINSAGTVNFGRLNFNSTGYVNISEDSDMRLDGILTANDSILYSTGSIADQEGTQFTATRNATFQADVGIYIADHGADRYWVCQYAEFSGPQFVIAGRLGELNLANLFVFPTVFEDVTFNTIDDCD